MDREEGLKLRIALQEIRDLVFPICYNSGDYLICNKIDAILKPLPKPPKEVI
jgi:hypothetical protein